MINGCRGQDLRVVGGEEEARAVKGSKSVDRYSEVENHGAHWNRIGGVLQPRQGRVNWLEVISVADGSDRVVGAVGAAVHEVVIRHGVVVEDGQ